MSSQTWDLVEKVISHSRCTLLYGPPSTGKSFFAHTAGLTGRNLYTVTLTEETPMAEIRGFFAPQGKKFQWMDGAGIRAWREGARLVLNEIDHAGADCLSFLLNLLDTQETAMITLPNGETLRPHPDFTCVATTNASPDDLPAALADRFPVAVEVKEAHPEGLRSLPDDLRQAAAGSVVAEPERRITLRSWKCFADLRSKIGEEAAALAVFSQRAGDVLDGLKIAKGA
jgi:MoxR-like ATPase